MNDPAGEEARGLAALGAAIRTLRVEAKLGEDELAARAEIEAALFGEVESGGREPTWGDLRRIARGLGVPLEYLLALAEELEEAKPG